MASRRSHLTTALVLGLALVLSSCTGAPAPTPSDTTPATPVQNPWEGQFEAQYSTGEFLDFAPIDGYEVSGVWVDRREKASAGVERPWAIIERIPKATSEVEVPDVVFDAEGIGTGYRYIHFRGNADGSGGVEPNLDNWTQACPDLAEVPGPASFDDVVLGDDGLVEKFSTQVAVVIAYTAGDDERCGVVVMVVAYERTA